MSKPIVVVGDESNGEFAPCSSFCFQLEPFGVGEVLSAIISGCIVGAPSAAAFSDSVVVLIVDVVVDVGAYVSERLSFVVVVLLWLLQYELFVTVVGRWATSLSVAKL